MWAQWVSMDISIAEGAGGGFCVGTAKPWLGYEQLILGRKHRACPHCHPWEDGGARPAGSVGPDSPGVPQCRAGLCLPGADKAVAAALGREDGADTGSVWVQPW